MMNTPPRQRERWESNAAYYMRLSREHPYQVTVKRCISKIKAGRLPKRHEIGGGKVTSWVTYRNRKDGVPIDSTVVFGFKTEEAMVAFKKEYKL